MEIHLTGYSHRHNPDGTFDAICRRCFRTVAQALTEEDLKTAEEAHICDEMFLKEWQDTHLGARAS
jgi:hypothetical protein